VAPRRAATAGIWLLSGGKLPSSTSIQATSILIVSRKKKSKKISHVFGFQNIFLWPGDAKVAAQSLEEMLRVSPDLRTLAQLVLAYAKFDLKQVTS
jgi:hypothetical protein